VILNAAWFYNDTLNTFTHKAGKILQEKPTIILGIDPGTVVMGYGLIAVTGSKLTLLELDILKPGKVDDPYKKLQLIYNTVSGLIIKYKPSVFAI